MSNLIDRVVPLTRTCVEIIYFTQVDYMYVLMAWIRSANEQTQKIQTKIIVLWYHRSYRMWIILLYVRYFNIATYWNVLVEAQISCGHSALLSPKMEVNNLRIAIHISFSLVETDDLYDKKKNIYILKHRCKNVRSLLTFIQLNSIRGRLTIR